MTLDRRFLERKMRRTLDYIFGWGVGSTIPEGVSLEVSRKTGKVTRFLLDDKILGTMRRDGGVALTVQGATILTRHAAFRGNCVGIRDDFVQFAARGRSVFSKHVSDCGSEIRPNSEVAVVDSNGGVRAVGSAVLPSSMMGRMQRGVAVKVRSGGERGKA